MYKIASGEKGRIYINRGRIQSKAGFKKLRTVTEKN